MIASPNLSFLRPNFLHRRSAAYRRHPPPPPLRFPAISAAFTAQIASAAHSRSISLYEVLGLKHEATMREIKAAYRSLARACHPDVRSGASADEFMSVHAAYSTLSDPAKRAEYDRDLVDLRRSPPFGCRFSDRVPRRTWETDQCW